jgi:serine/threonine protein kinase/formylglycine-generating enzyme required for sulfatase activity/lipoprotein NlpI
LDNEGASLTKTLETPVRVMKPGSLIAGKYKIIDEIGHGGMGVVHRAEDLKLKRSVALKFLPPHLLDSPELKERFLIEAQAAAALSHPNICVIHEVGESDEQPYIAMEYVEGETLRDRINRGPLTPEEAMAIAAQVAAGLGEAHGKGIVHRDIKSANIMVTAKGQAKVMDFGLAKLRGGSSLTKSQTTLGTVAYMSPEQARGGDLDQRTDIWSLGVVLYEMLAGKLPFRGDHDQTVIYSILHQEPESLTRAKPGTAPELDQIVGLALAKKAADRYQTMDEFREDLTAVAEGQKSIRAAKAEAAKRKIARIKIAVSTAVLAGLIIAGALILPSLIKRFSAGSSPASKSIAVLPFKNLSQDPGQEHFCEGLTDEIRDRLFRVSDLKVISRTSSMRFKDSERPLKEIASELGVSALLEGSVQRSGDDVRVTVQLIDPKTDIQQWSNIYNRGFSDIFSVYAEVAQAIASELRAVVKPEEKKLLDKVPTKDMAAYDAYLTGRSYWRKLTKNDLETALKYFEQARDRDPEFAQAYAGIGDVWIGLQQMGFVLPAEARPKILQSAARALELDDTSAEVHYTLALMKASTLWDWQGSEEAYKKAISLNPNHAEAHAYYSGLLSIVGRPDEAMTHIQKALELDPLNSLIRALYGVELIFARRYDEAITAFQDVLEMDPAQRVAGNIVTALWLAGKEDEALERWLKDFTNPDYIKVIKEGYAEAGFAGARRRFAEARAERSKVTYINPMGIATSYAIGGDIDNSLLWLEKAYQEHDPNMIYISVSPIFDKVRDDPRFQDLLRRMNLPERRAERERKPRNAEEKEPGPVPTAGQIWREPETGMEFVWIPGGEFMMGSNSGDADEKPVHGVRITKGFWMGRYEVTQGEWRDVTGGNPSNFKKGDDYPVESVSWESVQGFIRKLNARSGREFRLPTEAEWEYACRAGTSGERYGNIDDIAWYDRNSGGSTQPVGRKAPNAFGLYDMLGNVWELVQDWYDEGYSAESPRDDPSGPSSGSRRVCRGGTSFGGEPGIRSAIRGHENPVYSTFSMGFRLARND